MKNVLYAKVIYSFVRVVMLVDLPYGLLIGMLCFKTIYIDYVRLPMKFSRHFIAMYLGYTRIRI